MTSPRFTKSIRGRDRFDRERGVALIAVLLVLVSITVLALGSLLLTNTNLWMSENLVSNSVARSQAEAGIDATVAALFDAYSNGAIPPMEGVVAPTADLADGSLDYELVEMTWSGNRVNLSAIGRGPRSAEYRAEALVEFTGALPRPPTPFEGAVVACEGLSLEGGGLIDAFDSREGSYSTGRRLWAANVRTVAPDADIVLTGGTGIYGDLHATGGVEVTGGADVYGDINASDDVHIGSAGEFQGDIRTTGDLVFTNSAHVTGNVSSNGRMRFDNAAEVDGHASSGGDMVFTNASARVHGDAHIGGTYVASDFPHIGGNRQEGMGPVRNLPVSEEECDPLDIGAIASELESRLATVEGPTIETNWPNFDWRVSPTEVQRFDETWDVKSWVPVASSVDVEELGEDVQVVKTGDFDLVNGEVRITGGDVVLFVDGDFAAATGGGRMVIEDGSSLTVYVTGKTRLGSSFEIVNEYGERVTGTIAETGRPTFSIFSSYEGEMNRWNPSGTAGVIVEGGADVPVNIYAPKTGVYVTAGGKLFGTIRGEQVQIPGGAGVHYDVALGEIEVGRTGGTESTPTFEILSRR